MLKNAGKKGFGLVYVILILALVLILGTSVVSLAGQTYKRTYTEINYEQAYISARSGLNVIVQTFKEGSEKGKESRAELLSFAKKLALESETVIGVDLPSNDMGEIEATAKCLEIDSTSNACKLIKVTVTATYKERTATVSANLVGHFIDEYEELENAVTVLDSFKIDKLATVLDSQGNIIDSEKEKDKMYSVLDTSDAEYFDQSTKSTTAKMDAVVLNTINKMYKINIANSLSSCSVAITNESCLLSSPNNSYKFKNSRPSYADSDPLNPMNEYASNFAVIKYDNNNSSITISKNIYSTQTTDPSQGLLYGLYIDTGSSSAQSYTLELTADTKFIDENDQIKESFIIIYLGSKPLNLLFNISNNGAKFTFHGWVFAPNADIEFSGHNQNVGIEFVSIQGGVIGKNVNLNKNVNMQYAAPSPQLTQLFTALKAHIESNEKKSIMWSVSYE